MIEKVRKVSPTLYSLFQSRRRAAAASKINVEHLRYKYRNHKKKEKNTWRRCAVNPRNCSTAWHQGNSTDMQKLKHAYIYAFL